MGGIHLEGGEARVCGNCANRVPPKIEQVFLRCGLTGEPKLDEESCPEWKAKDDAPQD